MFNVAFGITHTFAFLYRLEIFDKDISITFILKVNTSQILIFTKENILRLYIKDLTFAIISCKIY